MPIGALPCHAGTRIAVATCAAALPHAAPIRLKLDNHSHQIKALERTIGKACEGGAGRERDGYEGGVGTSRPPTEGQGVREYREMSIQMGVCLAKMRGQGGHGGWEGWYSADRDGKTFAGVCFTCRNVGAPAHGMGGSGGKECPCGGKNWHEELRRWSGRICRVAPGRSER